MNGRITYRLTGGLSSAQLESVRAQVLAVLGQIGVEIDHDGILRFLAQKPGVTVIGRRVCFEAVLDHEIVQWTRRMVEGFAWHEGTEHTLESLRTGIADGNFFAHDDTLAHRQFYWESELFQYSSLARMTATTAKSWRERVTEMTEKKIREHTFSLPADAEREIARIYAAAVRALGA
jgi:trimethylamine:corrinoid methyltransferase-like protein